MSPADPDPSLQTRLDVAEMKGMLSMALQNHGDRITGLENERDKLHTRLNEKGQRITVTEQEVREVKQDVADVKHDVTKIAENARQQFSRGLQTLVGFAAVAGCGLAIWQAVAPGF